MTSTSNQMQIADSKRNRRIAHGTFGGVSRKRGMVSQQEGSGSAQVPTNPVHVHGVIASFSSNSKLFPSTYRFVKMVGLDLKIVELNEDFFMVIILAPQYFYTDRSKAVLLLWFLTVTCS